MTVPRFTLETFSVYCYVENLYVVVDNEKEMTEYQRHQRLTENDVVELLNEQNETIQELQRELDKTIEMLNKEINSSEKAFDGLLKENQGLIKMLDNVANYMQKQHKDMPIDDFVEWWNNIVIKGLDGDVE